MWRALATPPSQVAASRRIVLDSGLCRYPLDAVSTRPAAETGQCGRQALSRRGISYEKIAFAGRALLRDGARIWGLRSARERRAASDRSSRAEDRSGRRRSRRSLSLLVARRLSPLRLRRSSRLAPASSLEPRKLAAPSLAPSPLASQSRLAWPPLRPPPLLLSFVCASVCGPRISPAVRLLHRLVLVVRCALL